MNLRLLLILAGGAAAVWSVRRWRAAIQLAMVLLILEGAIRKWVFPGAQDLVYFAKDVFFLGAYLGFLRERRRLRDSLPRIAGLTALISVAAFYGLLQVLNPLLPNLLVGVLGFKAYFFYVPLLWVVPATFPSAATMAKFLRRYALIAIPVGLLATAQFFSSPTSVLNTYARPGEGESFYATTFGSSSFVRVTGTFSFISGYTSYLLATVILLLGLLGTTRWRFRGNLLLFLALAMTLLGILMTGSRGPLILLAFVLPFYWWLVIREQGGGALFARVLLGMSLVFGIVAYAGEEAIGAFYGRASISSDFQGRLATPFLQPFDLLPQAGLFGFGIGASHQTAVAVTKGLVPYSWTRGIVVEGETGRIMLELGGLGFVLMYLIRLYLPLFALRRLGTLRVPWYRAVGTSCLLFLLAQILGGVVFDVVTGVYYWFFAGLLLRVIQLDREAVARRAAAPAPAVQGTPPQPGLIPAPVPRTEAG
ncbi:MAG TPA: hypothetical protein VJ885_09085 [Thermoanaerobaculia bacterium]|nr:hypothetical protein [Thermoanaerobaculia bacterium]